MGDITKVPMPAEVQTDVCALRSSASVSCVAEESGTEAQLASTSNQQHDSPDAHQEASRAQAHGRKHARDRNANGAPTRPHTKKGQWSEEEEMTLVLHHREVGNKWAAISKYLPLRSDNDVKNHWNSTLRSKSQQKHCTFLWLYAKDVESVADSEIARQQCFEAAQRAYDQLRDNGVCAASASAGHTLSSVHTRAVRRGASSTALAPRATNGGSRTPWSSSSHGGQYRPVRQTCDSYAGIVDKTDDSGSLSGDPQHLTECGGSHCTTGDLNESPFSGEGTQAFAHYQHQPQHHQHHHNPYASDAGVPLSARAGWAARHNGMGEFAADGEEGVVASREDMDGEVMMASGPGQHTMVSMPGSSGSGKTGGWDMPVVGLSSYAPGSVPKQRMMTGQGQGATSSGTACAAGAWLAANQAGWLNVSCPSPGLVMLQPGVNSLEDAIAMDLEDTSFDNLAVDTFLRIRERNQAAAAAANANMQQEQSTGLGMDVSMGGSAQTTESKDVPQDGELLNNPRLSVHAPSPSPFPYSSGGHMANTMHRDAGSDHSSCLSNPMSFGGNLGGCTSATAGSGAASGFPFTNNTNHSHHQSTNTTNPTSNTSNVSTQQPNGGMAGFMPVAATTTPDLLHMGFSHQHDGLGGEMEDQDTTLVMIKDEFASYGGDPLAGHGVDAADGANILSWSNDGNGYYGSSSNMFGVLGLSPRSGSGTARAAMAGAMFCMGNGGAAARSGPNRHSLDLPIHASYRSRALGTGTTGMFGASGGMMDGEAGSHLPGIGLRAEALPVDPTDPGSGDGSTQRHSSPADGQNGSAGGLSGFGGGAFEVSGIDGPIAGKPLPWGSADSTWSPAIPPGPPGNTNNADGMEMQPPSRMGGSWSADGYNHGVMRAGAAVGGFQPPLWTNATGGMASTGALNAFVGGGMIPEDQEGKGIGSEQWSGGMDAGGSTAYVDGVHGKGQGLGGSTSNGRKNMRANSAHLPRATAEASAAQAAGAGNAPGLTGPRVIIHKLPTTSKWNTAVAAAKGWPTGSNSRRQQH